MFRRTFAVLALPFALVACGGGGGDDPDNGDPPGNTTVSYQQDLNDLFIDVCSRCHGGAGGLQLDSYEQLMMGGDSGPVVIAGDPDNSILVQRIEDTDPAKRMPLMDPALSDNEIQTIRQWILEGAQDN